MGNQIRPSTYIHKYEEKEIVEYSGIKIKIGVSK
jgi:hypothetical protein